MKTKRIISTIVLSAALFIVSPVDVNAYKVTDKQVTPLSDTLTMYTLTYQFGFLNADMWMPLAASKTTKDGNQTSSVVLSTASIQDKKYFVPMRTNGSFTLLVLEQHEVGQSKGYIILEK